MSEIKNVPPFDINDIIFSMAEVMDEIKISID